MTPSCARSLQRGSLSHCSRSAVVQEGGDDDDDEDTEKKAVASAVAHYLLHLMTQPTRIVEEMPQQMEG
jgi:hypothetical protein